jgi:hypothetical protein
VNRGKRRFAAAPAKAAPTPGNKACQQGVGIGFSQWVREAQVFWTF